MDLWTQILIHLKDPSMASALDPYVFFLSRNVDQISVLMASINPAFVMQDPQSYILIKRYVGASFVVVSLLLGLLVLRRRSHHWWPLIILFCFWGAAAVVGSFYGESIIQCTPDLRPGMTGEEVQIKDMIGSPIVPRVQPGSSLSQLLAPAN